MILTYNLIWQKILNHWRDIFWNVVLIMQYTKMIDKKSKVPIHQPWKQIPRFYRMQYHLFWMEMVLHQNLRQMMSKFCKIWNVDTKNNFWFIIQLYNTYKYIISNLPTCNYGTTLQHRQILKIRCISERLLSIILLKMIQQIHANLDLHLDT